ncbi:hypothetical protein D3C76_1754190 [compost metagenome]
MTRDADCRHPIQGRLGIDGHIHRTPAVADVLYPVKTITRGDPGHSGSGVETGSGDARGLGRRRTLNDAAANR